MIDIIIISAALIGCPAGAWSLWADHKGRPNGTTETIALCSLFVMFAASCAAWPRYVALLW